METQPRGSTSHFVRFLFRKTKPLMVLGIRDLKHLVLGPAGQKATEVDLAPLESCDTNDPVTPMQEACIELRLPLVM